MRYVLRETVTERREEPLGDFLFSGDLASKVCHEAQSSPGSLILDNLVASRHDGEPFDAWLLRQVREILVLHLQTDDWRGAEGDWQGTRTQRSVESVVLSPDDRQRLVERYGRHPEVLAAWQKAIRQQDARFAA